MHIDQSAQSSLPSPPGFGESISGVQLRNLSDPSSGRNRAELAQVMQNKAWAIVKAQASSVMMSMFMFWMIGGNLSIFTIIFTVMFLFTPINSLLKVNTEFSPMELPNQSLLLQKFAFVGIHSALLCLALYKFANIGLIPVHPYDWIRLLPTRKVSALYTRLSKM